MTQIRPPTLPVWAETGDKAQPSNAEINSGWPLTTIPPSRQRFNWILNFLANGMRYLLQRGVSEWDADEDYPVGARVQKSGLTYIALIGSGNINQDPAAPASTYWERWGFSISELFGFVDAYLSKSVAGGSNVTLTAAEARASIINLTGAITANINVIVPASSKRWTVINNTTGAFTVTVKTAAGTGVIVLQGSNSDLMCDGTNVDYTGKSGATGVQFAKNTNLATHEFVQRALGNLAGRINATTTQTLAASTVGNAINLGAAASHTITLPLSTAAPAGSTLFFEGGTNSNTINVQGADTIGAGTGSLTSITLAANESILFESNNLGQWVIVAGSGQLPYSSLFGFTLGLNSYQKLPSGKIEITGAFTASATPGNPTPVTFPISAANGRNIQLSVSSAGTTAVSVWFDTLTGSGFNGHCSVASAVVHYRALID